MRHGYSTIEPLCPRILTVAQSLDTSLEFLYISPMEPTPRHWIREYFEALLIAGIFLGFSNTFLVKTFYIPSGSMEETLLIGDHLFVNRFLFGIQDGPLGAIVPNSMLPSRDVQRGDVVIFRSPKEPATDLVKRCIGIPGDEIHIVDKKLFINGEAVDDSSFAIHGDPRTFPNRRYLTQDQRNRDNFGPFEVPEGEYFFLGDNRDFSYDSRFWGSVPRRYIKGRAVMIYWSFDGEMPDGQTRESVSTRIGRMGKTFLYFFSDTRWGRSFHLIR